MPSMYVSHGIAELRIAEQIDNPSATEPPGELIRMLIHFTSSAQYSFKDCKSSANHAPFTPPSPISWYNSIVAVPLFTLVKCNLLFISAKIVTITCVVIICHYICVNSCNNGYNQY